MLDASAVLALLLREPGADRVAALLPDAVMSSVSLAEVVGKLAEHGMPAVAIQAAIDGSNLSIRDFDAAGAVAAGLLRPATRSLGLSLGDRACLALAGQLGYPAVTAELLWSKVALEIVVEVIRPGTAC